MAARKVKLCLVAAAAMLGLCQQVGAVDLLTVYDMAAQSDPALRRALHERQGAEELSAQARAGLLPSLSVDAETGMTRQNIFSSDNTVFNPGTSSFSSSRLSLTLNQPIYNRQSHINVRQARVAGRRAGLTFESARQDLLMRVATLYFAALAARGEYEFASLQRTAFQRHYDAAEIQRARGLASMIDLYDSRARLATVEALMIEAEDRWDDAVQGLREMNEQIPVDLAPLALDMPLSSPAPDDLDTWIGVAMAENPTLLAQRASVEISAQEVSRQRAGRLPRLDVRAAGNREKSGGTLFGGGSDVETSNVQLRLSVPVYEGGLLSSRVREATQALLANQQELERVERALLREVRSAFYGVKRSISRVEALAAAAAAQELGLEARQEGFRSGRFSLLEVLDAESDLFEVRRDWARARFDYVLNSLRLKQAVGPLGEGDLLTVNGWLQ